MAYYDALITQWATLTPGTTAAKLAQLNAEPVTGTVPAVFTFTGQQLFNCLDWTEFSSLTAAQQTQILEVCAMPFVMTGGAASFVGKMFVAFYTGKLNGPTILALTALAKAITQPWWAANGYPRAFDLGDISSAGLS